MDESGEAGDSAQERYDRMLMLGARTVFWIIPSYALVSFLYLDQPNYVHWALGFAWALAGVGVIAMRSGYRTLARACVLGTMIEAVSVLVLAGGPHSNHVSAIFPAIAGSAFLLSIRATIGTTVWFCLVFGASILLEKNDFYSSTPNFDASSVFAQIIAVCAFVASVLHTYQRALDKLTYQQRELTLREAEAAALVHGSPDGVALVNDDRSIRSLNPALERLLGRTEPVGPGSSALELAADDEGAESLETLLESGQGSAQFKLRNDTKKDIIISVNAQRLTAKRLEKCVQLTLRDVTREHTEHAKRLELERRLRQSEKMEAFGQFAGGVAHDFNNLLTGVMGHAELLQRALLNERDDEKQLTENLKQLIETAERGADITRGLLSFSRTDAGVAENVDVAQTLREFEPTLRRLLPEDIELETTSSDTALSAYLPLRAVEQIVMNLVTNSRDSMKNGGKVQLACSSVAFTETTETDTGPIKAGRYICLSVSDTGAGMSEDVKTRVFEPFFSTRRAGVGTGLGLSTVHGIVMRADGGISVRSTTGSGTTVSVYLPLSKEAKPSKKPDSLRPALEKGCERVLVCEDERSILSVVTRTLEQHGYQVFGYDDPTQALEAVKSGAILPQLLLTDVIMPKMNGRALSVEIRTHLHDLPVLFMSGHTDGILESRGVTREEFMLLPKPFTSKKLLAAVRECLIAAQRRPTAAS